MKLFFLTICFIAGAAVSAQDDVTLHIGDKVPDIKYSKWIKGEPVKKLKGDKLYVLEFWATWCGPCKAAMPKLTQLQKKYEGDITVIGVGVWEKVKKDEPYESSLPMVTKYVEGNTANMGYAVIADNNDQYMSNKWLKAAGHAGIPATFIVKDKKIIWMGHPILLDSTIGVIKSGNYHMEEYKLTFEKKQEESRKMIAGMRAAQKPVQEALDAKDYKRAFELMEKAKVDAPILKISMDNMKFTTLLKYVSHEEAKAFAKEWAKDFKSATQYVLSAVAAEEGLPKDIYLWAVANFETLNSSNNNPMSLHLIASVYAKGGEFKKAIEYEQKAIDGAKAALKEGKMVGSIMDYTVTEYEEALAGYKKAGLVAVKSE